MVKKLRAFYGTLTFITLLTRSRHWSYADPYEATSHPPPYFSKVHFNILPWTPRSSERSLPFCFSERNFV